MRLSVRLCAAALAACLPGSALAQAHLVTSGAEPGLFNAEIVWNGIPVSGQDPHSLEHAAPALTILAASAGPDAPAPIPDGSLEIEGAWARSMLPGQPTGGAYLTITNKGAEADVLLSASSPSAGRTELHSMSMVDDVMVMRPAAGGLEIAAGATVRLEPGGFHLMFLEVAAPFKEGDTVPLILRFAKAGTVELRLPVRRAAPGDHSSH